MRRFLLLTLALVLTLSCFACSTPGQPGRFYYLRSEVGFDGSDGVISSESRELSGLTDDPTALLKDYFEGPRSRDLRSPFPRQTQLLECSIQNNTLLLELDASFADLSGIDLTLACACIAKTAFEHLNVSEIHLRASGALLNGRETVILREGDILLEDDTVDKMRTELTLYYGDQQVRYLIGHNISINPAAHENVAEYLVSLLMEAPQGYSMRSVIPRNTRLLDCSISDGTCTLNFSSDFEANAYVVSYAQRLTLLSIVNTLTQLEDIQRVEFCVEGNVIVHYRNLSISKPLVFNEAAIGPVRTAVNEFDATLYVCNGSSQYLAAVPTRLRQSAGLTQAETVVNALFAFSNPNGLFTDIPEGTVLRSLSVKNGVCIIDLSEDFLNDGIDMQLALRSIAASVCSLEGIVQARILVEGEIPAEYPDLFGNFSPKSDWYL